MLFPLPYFQHVFSKRRRYPRHKLRFTTVAEIQESRLIELVIRDISDSGLQIELVDDVQQGELLSVDLPAGLAVDAMVIWRSNGLAGCRFCLPVSAPVVEAVRLRSEVARTGTQLGLSKKCHYRVSMIHGA